VEGVFNEFLDAALCSIDSSTTSLPGLKGFSQTPKDSIHILSNKDVEAQTRVITYGGKTKARGGVVIARRTSRKINILGHDENFEGIIPVTKISDPGDSGAMVADEAGRVIGIVFASNATTSFIIPISKIISHFKVSISHAM
jgi:hypothetical protein